MPAPSDSANLAPHHGYPTSDGLIDPAAYVRLPRLTGLALSPDGQRLVASGQHTDAKAAKYASALWQIPLDGGEPVRLTTSDAGESAPAFRPDDTLLFISSRPAGESSDDAVEDGDAALWQLPTTGEAVIAVRRSGGVGGPVVATTSGHVLLTGARLARSSDADDAARRKTRTDRKISAIWHTGWPIRYWDHELGVESPRLLRYDPTTGTVDDLLPDADAELIEPSYSITADGATVAYTWRPAVVGSTRPYTVCTLDVASGRRTSVAAADGWQFFTPRISPDGRWIALERSREGTFAVRPDDTIVIVAADGTGQPVRADIGNMTATEWVWSADSATLYVAGDLAGRGAVLAIDPATGAVIGRLAADAVYSSLCPSPDGRWVYALRSLIDSAPRPVRLDPAATEQRPLELPTPAPTPPLPGRLVELEVPAGDGTSVHAWLCLPDAPAGPVPLMLWIHGGPFGSYNAWSWRWNPWLAVARGWAVVMPDPALSTGYGPGWIDRAWPYLAQVVWRDLETVLDAVVARPEIDGDRVACLGASFGGFMTNWIAGHTDRFGAIVTHAGLWALDQQHATTDAANYKTGVFGRLAEHPDWYAENSPHNTVDAIDTPMLIVHGNRDYRVPVSEALRLWWDLVSRWPGDPATLPHRFLQLTGENHWVLSPGNAEIWYDAVLGFCTQHVLGQTWTPSPLL